MSKVFVFGSNKAGLHGAGSAKEALLNWGAVMGVGEGRRGNSYAIPTKDGSLKVLPLAKIEASAKEFLKYAEVRYTCEFHVVKIGCGLAGFKEEEIAPFFKDASKNVILPPGWRTMNGEPEGTVEWSAGSR